MDDLRDGSVSHPIGEKEEETVRKLSLADDDDTISPSVVARRPLASHSSSEPISRSYPQVTDLSAREEYRQSRKLAFPSESSVSVHTGDENLGSIVTQIKTDEEMTSADGLDDD